MGISGRVKRKRNGAPRKIEFIGWASKPLVEFLEAMNVDTEKEYSKLELETFILKYTKERKLGGEGKKKKVVCDERLFLLFGKKSFFRNKLYSLLQEHLYKKDDDSDDDESSSSSEEKDYSEKTCTRLRVKSSRSIFAAIVPENIKLMYLKKSLIKELLQDPTNFEQKVVGSFVRVKSDSNDISQKHLCQLQLVIGVENSPLAVEVLLKVANCSEEVPLSLLSDDDFSEEEVEDVRKRVTNGILNKFTVKDIELKAQMLHQDITKHSIAKELLVLKRKIDRANEKGWRRELFEYLDRKKMLQTPSEVEKLLITIPDVIEEEPEAPADAIDEEPGAPGDAIDEELEPLVATDLSGSKGQNGADVCYLDDSDHSQSNHGVHETMALNTDCFSSAKNPLGDPQDNFINVADALPCNIGGHVHDQTDAISYLMEANEPLRSETGIFSWSCPEKLQTREIQNTIATSVPEKELSIDAECSATSDAVKIQVEISSEEDSTQDNTTSTSAASVVPQEIQRKPVASANEMIELSSDNDEPEPDRNAEPTNVAVWNYKDPRGKMQGPFSLQALKRWNDTNFFPAGFTVWKTGQAPGDGVVLADVLQQSFR